MTAFFRRRSRADIVDCIPNCECLLLDMFRSMLRLILKMMMCNTDTFSRTTRSTNTTNLNFLRQER